MNPSVSVAGLAPDRGFQDPAAAGGPNCRAELPLQNIVFGRQGSTPGGNSLTLPIPYCVFTAPTTVLKQLDPLISTFYPNTEPEWIDTSQDLFTICVSPLSSSLTA